jgi:DNA-binding response OmpR family regulator
VHVLVVEDDPKLGPLLARVLESNDYQVTLARNASQARRVRASDVDLAVVDWMLPDGDGLVVSTELRRAGFERPILMLTARGEVHDRVYALDLGADDYLTKPFEIEELLARLRALVRRGPRLLALDRGPLHFDFGRRLVFVRDRFLDLTDREFDLLAYLSRRPGHTISKAELIEYVWEADEIVPNVVEVHVSRLRDKLGADAGLVETVRNQGYRLRDEAAG